MVVYLNWKQTQRRPALSRSMHADRKRVFVDAFKWDLDHDGEAERDQYDNERAAYLILEGRDSGDHLGSVRLLDSEGPHLMRDVFPFLCDQGVPQGPDIKEITRFFASARHRSSERLAIRNQLARSLIELAHANGINGYTAVCEMGFLQQVLSAGWRCKPLGLPQMYKGSLVGAFMIVIEPNTLELMTPSWRWDRPALRFQDQTALAA